MTTVAYLANQFPSPVESYVADEISELRRRGVNVIPCSARRPLAGLENDFATPACGTLYFFPLRWRLMIRAAWLCLTRFVCLKDLVRRVCWEGSETPMRRLRALAHTYLGAYYALLLEKRGVQHIHVHHGYFSSWVGMIAARLLGITFSMTLHGSDLLVHRAYLDVKLKLCLFCTTVSEFNRRFLLDHHSGIAANKIVVRRIGVDLPEQRAAPTPAREPNPFVLLAVGRLHAVKDHAFLVRACQMLKHRGMRLLCLIAGEGAERARLEKLIAELGLLGEVRLLGHLSRDQLDGCYAAADLIVLTSRSEGIPLGLMEAMARGKLVLAPAITGIPELVQDGKTGFLYPPGSQAEFVARAEMIAGSPAELGPIRCAAWQHVAKNFDRERNRAAFCDLLLDRISQPLASRPHENPVLQQIQLSL
jgi:glycosyltransferase involved in cell wall biosynthesis